MERDSIQVWAEYHPGVGIGFLNGEPAQKIFEECHRRYGESASLTSCG
jgi:hypothetical protein